MKRTGNSKIAVVGWGRGMGHKGHMYLADAVIAQAQSMKADPYFFVSKTVGKDDPIFPEEKVRIYQKVFPQYATIFEPQGNLNQALTDLAKLGYQGVVVVVGADQKQAFQYLEKPNKEGIPVYQTMGLKKLKVISRQETRSQFAKEEGPRATPMREILLDPNASQEEKFQVWRRDMPEQLGDRDVLDIMNKAESRLVHSNQPKAAKVKDMSQRAAKLKEAIINFRTKTEPIKTKEPETDLGYKHLFKSPDEPKKSEEKRFNGWAEYEREKNPEVEEGRILDGNSKVDLYYVTQSGARQIVFQSIPQRMLDKAIMVLRSKYPNINDRDIEMRPASHGEYTREGMAETKVSKYKDLGATKNTTHFIKNVTTGEIVSPHRGKQDAEDALVAYYRGPSDGNEYKIVRARKDVEEGLKGKLAAAALGAGMAASAPGAAISVAGAIPTPSHQAAMYKAAADSNRAEAKRQAELQKKADAERLEKNTEIVDKEQRKNHHLIPTNEDYLDE